VKHEWWFWKTLKQWLPKPLESPDYQDQTRRRKAVYEHRRDQLLEWLRLQRWLQGGEYMEDPPE